MDYGTTRGNNVDKLKPLWPNPQFHNLSLASSIGCLFNMTDEDKSIFEMYGIRGYRTDDGGIDTDDTSTGTTYPVVDANLHP